MVGFNVFKRNVEIDPSTFGKTELDTLVSEEKFVGLISPYNLDNNNQDADFATSTQKERSERIGGVKGWIFTFDEGNCFQNELQKFHKSKEWSIVPVLDDGSAMFRIKTNGKLSGFDINMFTNVFDPALTADISGPTLQVDVTPLAMIAWQESSGLFTPTEFSFLEIQPIAGLNIETPILVAAATTTVLTITALCADSPVIGLTDPTNWAVDVDGTRTSPTNVAYDANNKKYTLTHAALTAGAKVSFITAKNGYNIYVKDGNYYSGQSVAKVVTA
ncbi:hypothetical protein CMT89_08225 [Elizabethkingia anophelis]|uniref:Uncharacterized protein n=2 Tax=Elizabethkingia anophelis TaxID=1117645 RepID=A0A494JDU7_9FLAO|nr:hypothetical protein AYC66_17810 [Elizabethkingia anophelis]MDV3470840.1 hypothetical protein [Elizabethkingia anophelis]MDV3888450.1 hypothetical protein [Elizabethkingia anophelis]MDV3901176.1 hypothetical protein [Elizabethkingia anophelis]MDV3904923.1 hypothetical protein [Elizabethkingia anophelis]